MDKGGHKGLHFIPSVSLSLSFCCFSPPCRNGFSWRGSRNNTRDFEDDEVRGVLKRYGGAVPPPFHLGFSTQLIPPTLITVVFASRKNGTWSQGVCVVCCCFGRCLFQVRL